MFKAVVLFALVALAFAQTTPRNVAKIEDSDLPGLTFETNFDQYAGYINLEGTTKNMFYWFFTSQSDDPTQDPVILWLQGGPGCSGVGDGLFLEHGPYYPDPDFNDQTVQLISNFHSWNREANVIYIESPCGVGFSYGTNVPADYETNDNITALDNFMFLKGFFDMYDEFSMNPFWITGESYAGVYIPTLAHQVLTNDTAPQLTENLKNGGLMLGNPVTNCNSLGNSYTGQGNLLDLNTKVEMFYWHAMVSRRNYDEWNEQGCAIGYPVDSLVACYQIYQRIQAGIGHLDQPLANKMGNNERVQPTGSINPDMLYFSYCVGNGTLDFDVASVPQCFGRDDQVSTYLNDPDVISAINAQLVNGRTWVECTSRLDYHKLAVPAPNYLNEFFSIAPTMRIMYYSGDVDLDTVPFGDTQRCLETMNRPIEQPWRPYVMNKEVAGYVEVYDTYTYATVKGAGHEAPQFQPAANFLLFKSFLNNEDLPGAGI